MSMTQRCKGQGTAASITHSKLPCETKIIQGRTGRLRSALYGERASGSYGSQAAMQFRQAYFWWCVMSVRSDIFSDSQLIA